MSEASSAGDPSPQSVPNITITFPIVFVTGPPPGQSNGDESTDHSHEGHVHHHTIPPEDMQNLFERWLRAISFVPGVNGQYEPMPTGPPKKHATQNALDKLRRVDVASLPESDRRCHICMQDYFVRKNGPRSPYVEDVKDEDELDGRVRSWFGRGLIVQDVNVQPAEVPKEEGEVPLEMPCGHVFGSICLKEWLYQSPTCPLCRVEVESYTEEPQLPQGAQGLPPFTGLPSFSETFPTFPPSGLTPFNGPPQSDEMQIDSETSRQQTGTATPQTETSASASDPTEPQPQRRHFPPIAFQFVFTTPPNPPNNTDATNSNTSSPSPAPPISRPASAHTIRHHPYARIPTPSTTPSSPFPTVIDRPDLFCAQRGNGLCSHDITDESLLRLQCGHAFHADCLEGSMIIDGYPITEAERRCPRCRRWMEILQ